MKKLQNNSTNSKNTQNTKKLQTNQEKEMQGFPKEFKLPDSRSKSLKLLGNSVAVNAVHAVAKQMILYMDNKESFIKGDQLKLL